MSTLTEIFGSDDLNLREEDDVRADSESFERVAMKTRISELQSEEDQREGGF